MQGLHALKLLIIRFLVIFLVGGNMERGFGKMQVKGHT